MSFASNRLRGDAVRRAHADQAGRELVEIGLAENERARRAQPRDGGRVLARPVGEGRARRRGRQAADVDVVLDRDRDAVERQRRVLPSAQAPAPRRRTSASSRSEMKIAGSA